MKFASDGAAGQPHRNTRWGSRAWAARLSAATTALVVASLLGLVPAANADDLDDQAAALQRQASDTNASLEFVDAGIAKSASDLVMYQGQLPGAQAALAQAQTRVVAATDKVTSLGARIDLAEANKAKINTQMALDSQKATDTKSKIGQIAAQSYKAGGLPANLSLLLGVGGDNDDLAGSIDLAEAAMRSQNAVLEQLNAQKATNSNAKARLVAVEAEIRDLKTQADAALIAEQAARDQAEAQKATVDKLISDSAAINAKLEAQKPTIQAKLKAVQAQQGQVASQIAERQRRELEAARKAAQEEAARVAREQAAQAAQQGNNNFVPPPYVAPPQGNVSAFGLRHPFAANVPITSPFVRNRPVPPGTLDFNGTGFYDHTGIDFGAPCGTPVYAPADGTVTLAGQTTVVYGGGNVLWISHGVKQGNALMTVYYHNSAVLVSAGQQVRQGQLVAYSGSTGNSTGCHAHFETWLNGVPVDPMRVL